MLYLLLNIIFGSAFILVLKWVQVRGREEIVTVGCINYITAAIAMAPVVFLQTSPSELEMTPALLGSVNGICYFVAFFFVIYMIRWIGVASSNVISALSMLMPIGFGILVWDESPTAFQLVGVVLAMISLSLIGDKPKDKLKSFDKIDLDEPETHAVSNTIRVAAMIIFFILCGLSRLAQEAFRYLCDRDQTQLLSQYTLAAFVVAAIPSIVVLIVRRKKIVFLEIVFGVVLGLSNLLQVHFVLESLKVFEGYIVFPVTSAGGMVLITLVATQLLGEKLSVKTYICISIATLALVLLKLQF